MNGFLASLIKEMNRDDISEERRTALRAIYDQVQTGKPAGLTAPQEKELRDALASITITLESTTLSENARSELIKYYHEVEKILDPLKKGSTLQ